jgi:hypothetical protein
VNAIYDKFCHLLDAGRWFFPGALVSSTNKTDFHDITEIFLKVALNTINQPTKKVLSCDWSSSFSNSIVFNNNTNEVTER